MSGSTEHRDDPEAQEANEEIAEDELTGALLGRFAESIPRRSFIAKFGRSLFDRKSVG